MGDSGDDGFVFQNEESADIDKIRLYKTDGVVMRTMNSNVTLGPTPCISDRMKVKGRWYRKGVETRSPYVTNATPTMCASVYRSAYLSNHIPFEPPPQIAKSSPNAGARVTESPGRI